MQLKSALVALAAMATSSTLCVSWGQASGDLFYTRFGGGENVKRVTFDYDGVSTFTLQPPVTITSTPGADGIIFAPDGDLLVGGQGDRLHKIDPMTGSFCTTTVAGTASFHLALDPDLARVWSAGIPNALASVVLSDCPLAPGQAHPLSGDDTVISSIAFDPSGTAYYTTANFNGFGDFGIIDLVAFTTTRLQSNLPAAHGMIFDGFTGHLMLAGANHITQIDPAAPGAVVSDRVVAGLGQHFDQVSTDGIGHMFVADNGGNIFFMDYSSSGLVADAGNFTALQFLDTTLDDIAPLSGLGAPSCFTLDFETGDDFQTALVNGELVGAAQFGSLVTVSSSGPNAGAAIFDSSPAGPNNPSQDLDLLVDCGNILILQNDAVSGQAPPGIFAIPNDDADGGVLSFEFLQPVAPQSVDLIDIDMGSSEASGVTLIDAKGRARVYTVPPDWTGDFMLGETAKLTLDLTTLADQVGFASTATASEDAAFDPSRVVTIDIMLGSSGGVDNLAWCEGSKQSIVTRPRLRGSVKPR